MSLVLITGDGPEHRYVANIIGTRHEITAILVCDPPPRRSWRRVLRRSPALFLDKALRQVFLRITGDRARREATVRRVLGPRADAFDRPDLVSRVGRPREGLLARRVAELAPEVIAVYGTGIVPDEVLSLARSVALNMHTGLSPWYRGTACDLWPIVEGRPEMVGATVHECVAEVDGGRIFRRVRAPLRQGDDLHAVFARAVAAGAEAYAEVIGDALEGSLAGEPQDLSAGREYRGDMLGIRAEIRARLNIARLSRGWAKEES